MATLKNQFRFVQQGWLARLWRDESGQDVIEYGLLAATVSIIAYAVLPLQIVPVISQIFSALMTKLVAAGG